MKIDYISDTHFDEHLRLGKALKEDFHKQIAPIFETKQSDTLLVAGDIGENNDQTLEALRLIRDEIGYKSIVMVLGNHDYFLPNPEAREKYNNLSINRVDEFKQMIANEDGMYLLDGDIIDIDGIHVGGAMGWYNGSYVFQNLNPHYVKDRDYLERLWKEFIPDYDTIYGCCNTYDEFFSSELEKIEKIHKNCDVMITHINPSIRPEHTAARWRKEDTTGFFCFDGKKFLQETTASHWIFGHSHDQKEFEIHGVKCVSNPLGYPGESDKGLRVRSIEV